MKDDPAVRTVAKTIIRCAQQGIRDVVMNFAPRAETKACDPALSYKVICKKKEADAIRKQMRDELEVYCLSIE
jgi:hypothetical protein